MGFFYFFLLSVLIFHGVVFPESHSESQSCVHLVFENLYCPVAGGYSDNQQSSTVNAMGVGV